MHYKRTTLKPAPAADLRSFCSWHSSCIYFSSTHTTLKERPIAMDNHVYIPLSRQLALFRDMDVTANNLANVNTVGYGANKLLFNSYLYQDNGRGKMAFAHDVSTYRNLNNGGLRQTGNTFDVGLGGDGYFVVQTPLGDRYTRAGNFQLDAEGRLVTTEGYPVLDQNGATITFTQDDRNVVIGEAGNIVVDGEERSIIGIVDFENPQELRKAGDRMYTTEQAPIQAVNPRLAQGTVENSNVTPVLEMTHMVEVSRAVASTAKFIEVIYELQRRHGQTWTQQN